MKCSSVAELIDILYDKYYMVIDIQQLILKHNHKLVKVKDYEKDKLNCWIVCHYDNALDRLVLIADNYRVNEKETFVVNQVNGSKYKIKQYPSVIKAKASKSFTSINDMQPLSYQHQYLKQKGIRRWSRYGLYQDNNNLIIPYHNKDGYESIYFVDGKKRIAHYGNQERIYFSYCTTNKADYIILGEGFADVILALETLETCCDGKGILAACSFGATKLIKAFTDLLYHNPNAKFIHLIDNDNTGNKLKNELLKIPHQNKIITFNDVKDASEYIIKYGSKQFIGYIKSFSWTKI